MFFIWRKYLTFKTTTQTHIYPNFSYRTLSRNVAGDPQGEDGNKESVIPSEVSLLADNEKYWNLEAEKIVADAANIGNNTHFKIVGNHNGDRVYSIIAPNDEYVVLGSNETLSTSKDCRFDDEKCKFIIRPYEQGKVLIISQLNKKFVARTKDNILKADKADPDRSCSYVLVEAGTGKRFTEDVKAMDAETETLKQRRVKRFINKYRNL